MVLYVTRRRWEPSPLGSHSSVHALRPIEENQPARGRPVKGSSSRLIPPSHTPLAPAPPSDTRVRNDGAEVQGGSRDPGSPAQALGWQRLPRVPRVSQQGVHERALPVAHVRLRGAQGIQAELREKRSRATSPSRFRDHHNRVAGRGRARRFRRKSRRHRPGRRAMDDRGAWHHPRGVPLHGFPADRRRV